MAERPSAPAASHGLIQGPALRVQTLRTAGSATPSNALHPQRVSRRVWLHWSPHPLSPVHTQQFLLRSHPSSCWMSTHLSSSWLRHRFSRRHQAVPSRRPYPHERLSRLGNRTSHPLLHPKSLRRPCRPQRSRLSRPLMDRPLLCHPLLHPKSLRRPFRPQRSRLSRPLMDRPLLCHQRSPPFYLHLPQRFCRQVCRLTSPLSFRLNSSPKARPIYQPCCPRQVQRLYPWQRCDQR